MTRDQLRELVKAAYYAGIDHGSSAMENVVREAMNGQRKANEIAQTEFALVEAQAGTVIDALMALAIRPDGELY